MASARAKAEQAQQAAGKAQSDADKGRQKAYSYDPNFVQPGEWLRSKSIPTANIAEYQFAQGLS